jgi:hypothetical protein
VTYTRLTAQSALESLRKKGFSDDDLPSASTMSEILNTDFHRLFNCHILTLFLYP